MKKSDLLAPLGLLYGAVIDVRRACYQQGIFKSSDLAVPTISIGNITVGGTGKTPLVAFTARILAARGEKVCVLTRGYKRSNERVRVLVSDGENILSTVRDAGDEPFELAQKLLGKASVIADADRAGAGNWARQNWGATVFVLDDAFQHFKVKRDLDIVCVDATNPFGSGKLLPGGILREPLPNLSRAGAVVVTRANLIAENQIADLKVRISGLNQTAKIFVSRNRIAGLSDLEFFPVAGDSRKLDKTPAAFQAFCALGNPESFFQQLRSENLKIVATRTFPDHHFYAQKDIDDLERAAGMNGAEALLTTAKDAVKMKNLKFKMPVLVVESELVFDDEAGLRKLISEAGRAPASVKS